MADLKASAATTQPSPPDALRFLASDAGADKAVTYADLKAALAAYAATFIGNAKRNQSTANQSAAASATTYIVGSTISFTAGTLGVGTRFFFKIVAQKTGAGTVAPAIVFKMGTVGDNTDTTLLTLTFPAGTGVIDNAEIEVDVTVRSVGAGTAAVVQGTASMKHGLQITGWSVIPAPVTAPATSAGFNSTTQTKAGVSLVLGASWAVTITQVFAEATNL